MAEREDSRRDIRPENDPEWLKREIGSKMNIEIKPRAVVSTAFCWFVRPFGGRIFLKFVFLAGRHLPEIFAENGIR